MKAILERQPDLETKQMTVTRLVIDDDRICGVETNVGVLIRAESVIITAGTFLRGLLHVGEHSQAGGRMADSSSALSENLREIGFEVGRFKTGTPCRINRRSIDFSKCEIQLGDDPPPRFSFLSPPHEAVRDEIFSLNASAFHVEQLPCWITSYDASNA